MIKTKEEVIDFLQKNKDFLKEKYHIQKIALFGSFARNEQKLQSDIDLLIELEEDVKNIHDIKEELRQYLSASFERNVDLARMKYLKPYAKERILKDLLYV